MWLQYQLANSRAVARLIADLRIDGRAARFYVHVQGLCVLVNHMLKLMNLHPKPTPEGPHSRAYPRSHICLGSSFTITKQLTNSVPSGLRVLLLMNQLSQML